MNLVNATLLYLLISRLAFVGAGVISIVMGYRLFCRGIGGVDAGQGSDIESSFTGLKLSLKNTAPGTAFALFGAALIIVMLIQSSPNVVSESVQKSQAATSSEPSETSRTDKFQARGDSQSATSIASLTDFGRELQDRGKNAEAERKYRDAVTIMAEPMNDLASLYLDSGRNKEALSLAVLAVQLRPDEPRFSSTLVKARGAAK